ncbi:MAG: TlpA disulfide reductase family protein [Bacteroidales bacterium]
MITSIRFLAVLLMASLILSCSPKKSGYDIQIHIEGLGDGTVYLGTYDKPDFKSFTYDSAHVVSGTARLTGSIGIPHLMNVSFSPQRISFQLFVDNSKISIISDTSRYNKQTHKLMVDVEGSKLHAHWKQLYRDFFPQYYNLKDSLDRDNSGKGKTELQKQWSKELYNASKKILSYLSENPNDVVAARMLFDLNQGFSYYFDELSTFVKNSGPDIKRSWIFPYFEKEYAKLVSIQPGRPAPVFTLKDTRGIPVALNDFKGKVVLLDFWAYWCGPCRAFFPELKLLYNDYHERGFEIIGINTDPDRSKWYQAISEEKILWVQVIDTTQRGTHYAIASSNYCITSIPTSFLINRDGIIVNRNIRGDELRRQVDSLIQITQRGL